MPAPALTVVFVADTFPDAVLRSLTALAAAVDAAEAAGRAVEVVVVDVTGDPRVASLLAGLEGATVLALPSGGAGGASCAGQRAAGADGPGADGAAAPAAGAGDRGARMPGLPRRAAPWARGVAAATGGHVLLTGADAAVAPDTLLALLEASGEAVVLPAPEPGPYLLAPRAALATLSWGDGSLHAVRAALRRAGLVERTAPGAGCLRQRVRHRIDGSRWSGARLDLAGPGTFSVGPATYAGEGSVFKTWAPSESIELGAYCSLSDDVRLLSPGGELVDERGAPLGLRLRGHHRPETATTFPLGGLVPEAPFDEPPPGARGRPLAVGDDVWIGYGATVIGNVTVGTGAIVGTGALVRTDVEPYAVVAGVPARVIGRRFADEVARRLLRIGWWDWPEEIVRGNWRWFQEPAQAFVEHFDPAGGPAARGGEDADGPAASGGADADGPAAALSPPPTR